MKAILTACCVLLSLVILSAAFAAKPLAAPFTETFDSLRPDRWQAVLGQSPKQGTVAAKKGELCLKSPWKEPCDVDLFSRFFLSGDFCVVASYRVDANDENCRTNSGLILETKDGGVSYKCYVATAPGAGRFYRARLDLSGVSADELVKGGPAPAEGELRITREKGRIAFFKRGSKGWEKVHEFSGECVMPLGIRLKLSTGGTVTDWKEACPATFCVTELSVERCERIVEK